MSVSSLWRLAAGLVATLCVALLCAPAARAQSDGFIARMFDKAVPGGTASVVVGKGGAAPEVSYDGHRVMVLNVGGQWVAVIGIALTTKPGRASIGVR